MRSKAGSSAVIEGSMAASRVRSGSTPAARSFASAEAVAEAALASCQTRVAAPRALSSSGVNVTGGSSKLPRAMR